MNRMAESITGVLKQEVLGKDIGTAMRNSENGTKEHFRSLVHSV
jgi:hypothetical protein